MTDTLCCINKRYVFFRYSTSTFSLSLSLSRNLVHLRRTHRLQTFVRNRRDRCSTLLIASAYQFAMSNCTCDHYVTTRSASLTLVLCPSRSIDLLSLPLHHFVQSPFTTHDFTSFSFNYQQIANLIFILSRRVLIFHFITNFLFSRGIVTVVARIK